MAAAQVGHGFGPGAVAGQVMRSDAVVFYLASYAVSAVMRSAVLC